MVGREVAEHKHKNLEIKQLKWKMGEKYPNASCYIVDRGRIQLDSNFLSCHKPRGGSLLMPDSINLFFFFSPQIWYHIGHVLHFGHDDLLAFAIYDIRGKKWRKSRFTGTLWQCPRFSFPHRTCGNKSDKIIRLGTLLTELFSEYLKDTLGMRIDKETFICGACQNLNSSWRFIVTQRLGSLAL